MSWLKPVFFHGAISARARLRSRVFSSSQFLSLVSTQAFFVATLSRWAASAAPVVLTGAYHLEYVDSQLGSKNGAEIIVELSSRADAAAVALAALQLARETIMLACLSCNHIVNPEAFPQTACDAVELPQGGWLTSSGTGVALSN
ncbi:mannose-1-phosphate guanylyltransferase [Novosphingobium chloroacetimidivorans]|uniref:Mannose-1-phosphate guanylyltransferase n=1 Tax=Novosphingobium chloroacetimidivorans TaxID=1428314 RepID=A0A7W7KFH0_9SPHN|nr:hypothetical protein [Novosphingobium chloroacetimidivorans]MBB4861123.1 mannose-1-phosphate guanylyltransferase [Novosphingobium chloroacetimidivorans]